jgi:MFS transporter, NNP family, nitrate/nitrite transporter
MKKGFLSAGQLPTLFASFLYFDMSFMVWVLLGPLGVQIAKELDLSPAQKGFMVAVPVLSGALLALTGVKSRWRRTRGAAVALGSARI